METSILKLYIIRLSKRGDKSQREYRIAYAVATEIPNGKQNVIVSGISSLKGTFTSYSLARINVTVVDKTTIILDIINSLVKGMSLKTCLTSHTIDVSNLDFDVSFGTTFNDIPQGMTSDIDKEVVVSKIYELEDKSTLVNAFNATQEDISNALSKVKDWLENATTLPFTNSYEAHLGNIEMLSQPTRDLNGRSLIFSEWNKKDKKQILAIDKSLAARYTEFVVNLHVVTKGIVTEDGVATLSSNGNDIVKEFSIKEPYDSIRIRIWGNHNDQSQLLFDKDLALIRSIQFNANIIGSKIKINTQWLEDVRNSTPESYKKSVDKAAEIVHSTSESFVVGESNRPKYKEARKISTKINDAFFPQGWNASSGVHGRIAFLDWFKERTKQSVHVFFQDPYLEDIALHYIALAASACECTILTQTKLKTNSDGTASVSSKNGNTRGEKIINLIKSYPTLFRNMKLVIKDIDSANNVLHDRYLFFYYEDGHCEGYSLSNSLQGATVKFPLLITQIGVHALQDVEQHIKGLLSPKECKDLPNIETLYNYQDSKNVDTFTIENKEIADEEIVKTLNQNKNKSEEEQANYISGILQKDFAKGFSCLGYFLATNNINEELLFEKIASFCSDKMDLPSQLTAYLLASLGNKFPIGLVDTPESIYVSRNNLDALMELGFDQIVNRFNVLKFNFVETDGISYGAWGVYFACKFLICGYQNQSVNLLGVLQAIYSQAQGDKSFMPIGKLSNMFLSLLLFHIAYIEHDIYLPLLLNAKGFTKALGCLELIYNVSKGFSDLDDYKGLVDPHEAIAICHTALGCNQDESINELYYAWLLDIYRQTPTEVCEKIICNILTDKDSYHKYKCNYIDKIVLPLAKEGKVDIKGLVLKVTAPLFNLCKQADISFFKVLPHMIIVMDIEPTEFLVRSNKFISNQESLLANMQAKDEDKLFKIAKPLAELRSNLKYISEGIKDKGYKWASKINDLHDHCDNVLSQIGYHGQWSAFDMWKKNILLK